VAGPKTSEQETAEEGGGAQEQQKHLLGAPQLLASLRTHRSASAVSMPRRWGFSLWDPVSEASLRKLGELTRKPPPCPALETTLPPQGTKRREKRKERRVILLPVLCKEHTGTRQGEGDSAK
jgi:hypothetical protein